VAGLALPTPSDDVVNTATLFEKGLGAHVFRANVQGVAPLLVHHASPGLFGFGPAGRGVQGCFTVELLPTLAAARFVPLQPVPRVSLC